MKKLTSLLILLTVLLGLTACGGRPSSGDQVRVYCFGDYIDPALIDRFEEETGIKVIMDTFDTNEEMYPVISKNSVQYDVICVSDYMIEKLGGEGKLHPIDKEKLSNYGNLDERYLAKAEDFDPGNRYAVPHTWGTLGILYNTEKIPKGTIQSWTDLWKEQYSQQIVMPDNVRDTLAIALKAKGYSINSTDEKELEEAVAYLIEQKPLVYKYLNDAARDMAISGSADLAVCWNGETVYSQHENEALDFVIPQEGTEEFMDVWAIPEASSNKDKAEKWIDFMLSKEAAMANYEYLTYSIPNKYVIEAVSADPKITSYLFPPDELLASCETLKNLGEEGDALYSRCWKKFKAE